MAYHLCAKALFPAVECYVRNRRHVQARELMSKQLFYYEFGEPCDVVKFREGYVPVLGTQDVLVRMLAAPVNPTDLNTIQGRNYSLPKLPIVPGDEGVADVIEIGKLVSAVKPGQRVVMSPRQLGTWRYYGVYNERDLHVISPNICLPAAAMLSVAPCTAYRMLTDFVNLHGATVVQNAANSPVGQSVIQICKAWGVHTINIVSNQCEYESVKEHLLNLGASMVCTLKEAESLTSFNTSVRRPVLALNCQGGRNEDALLKMLTNCGVAVYYGCAFDLPGKQCLRCDVKYRKFHLCDWNLKGTRMQKEIMYKDIAELIMTGKFRAPLHESIELEYFKYAFKNTDRREAFCNKVYVFDFSIP